MERPKRARWLELIEATAGKIAVDAIVLHGPDIAWKDEDLKLQTYTIVPRDWENGARILAENLGGNRFKVQTENVKQFRIYLSPQMGDLAKPFTVMLTDGSALTLKSEPVSGERDYMAALTVCVPPTR